jgi:hypothetical protein
MTIVLRVAAALLFAGAAALAAAGARESRRQADQWQQLVTLRYEGAAAPEAPTGPLPIALAGDPAAAARRQATVDYWLGRYDELVTTQGGATDVDVLFVAANAAFRAAREDRSVGPDAARQLDGVLQAYASVLKAAPRHTDAAFNFEYVSRLRDRLAVMKPPPPAKERESPRGSGPVRTADLPLGPTVHGLPGGPPPEIKAEEFQILTPRDLGDRESDPEQAPGSRMRRKG